MILPLDRLISYQGNMYELACAAMKRGIQLMLAGDEEVQRNRGKIVPTALRQILTQKVRYQIRS